MNKQRGVTMIELLVVIGLGIMLISVSLTISHSVLARSGSRSTIHQIKGLAELARVEAISRNRECRVLVSPDSREILVTDGMGTLLASDDRVLRRETLPDGVMFARPDAGSTVTWHSFGGTPAWFGIRFASDGTVTQGDGDVYVQGGELYGRLSVFGSGGTSTAIWKNGSWEGGTY